MPLISVVIFIAMIIINMPSSLAEAGEKSTTYSMCKRIQNGRSQSIIVAMETLSEKKCQGLGLTKAKQYTTAGWACFGLRGEKLFSCEDQKASSFAYYNGAKLDHLTFTNLLKHRSILAYLNPNSNSLCHEDRDELKSAGVRDAVCHRP